MQSKSRYLLEKGVLICGNTQLYSMIDIKISETDVAHTTVFYMYSIYAQIHVHVHMYVYNVYRIATCVHLLYMLCQEFPYWSCGRVVCGSVVRFVYISIV